MTSLWHLAYGIYAWAALLIVVLLTTTLLVFVPGLNRRRIIAHRSARLLLWLTGTGLEIRGPVPDNPKPCVVVANHASYIDGIILMAALPPRFSFLVKREMRTVPVAGMLLRRLGTEFVDRVNIRRGAADARRIIRTAAGGQSLAAFPESTFRQEPGLGLFYSGAFSAAVRNRLPVVPMTLRGSREILPANRLLPWPGKIDLIVHPSIPVSPTTQERAEMIRIRDLSRTRILSALDEPDLDFKMPAKPVTTPASKK